MSVYILNALSGMSPKHERKRRFHQNARANTSREQQDAHVTCHGACSSLTLTVIIRAKLKRSLDDREAGVRFINHECDYRPTWGKTIYILKFPRNIVKDMIERFHKFNSIVPLSTSQHSDYKFAITCQCSINRETMVFFFRHPHHEMGLMNNNLSFSVDGVGLLDCPKMENSLYGVLVQQLQIS